MSLPVAPGGGAGQSDPLLRPPPNPLDHLRDASVQAVESMEEVRVHLQLPPAPGHPETPPPQEQAAVAASEQSQKSAEQKQDQATVPQTQVLLPPGYVPLTTVSSRQVLPQASSNHVMFPQTEPPAALAPPTLPQATLMHSAFPPATLAHASLPQATSAVANLPHSNAGLPGLSIQAGSSAPPLVGLSADAINNVYIRQELQTMASRLDNVIRELSHVKQAQFQLEALVRSSTGFPVRSPLKATPPSKKRARKKPPVIREPEAMQTPPPLEIPPGMGPLPSPEPDESDGLYDWPPVKTVEECWKEMYEGLEGRPSLMALEEQYASAWRRRKGQRQRFCEKKQVCEYIKHLAAENRCSHQAAIQHLANKKESLCKLLLRLRQFKKSAREMEAAAAAAAEAAAQQEAMQGGEHAAQEPQGLAMQGVYQNGVHMDMQLGEHRATQPHLPVGMAEGLVQPGMHPGMHGGMQNESQDGSQGGAQEGLQTGMESGLQPCVDTGAQKGVQVGVPIESLMPPRLEDDIRTEVGLVTPSELSRHMDGGLQAAI